MAQILKRTLWVLIGLAACAVIVAAFQHKKLSSLYKVNTLFDADKIVYNFSHMGDAMFSVPVAKSTGASSWPKALRAFPAHYSWQNESRSIVKYLDSTQTTSLLVLHDGVIVHEDYRLGTRQTDLRISWSMAKSFLSAMFGIAVADGVIESLNDPVDKYVPTLSDTAYRGVPILNVLNMASGVEFDEDYMAYGSDINRMGRVLALGGSMDDFAHSIKTRARTPGTHRQYVSIDTHVLAMVLRQATGVSLSEFFARRLWSPLGGEGDVYYLADGNSVAFALGGLNMQTRDYARFGELFRLQGNWRGTQVVPASWVSASTSASAPPSVTDSDPFEYGFQWWVPPASTGDYFAAGIYGQFIYINPAAKIVIVKTSAHRDFRADNAGGRTVKHETVEMLRAISDHYSSN